MAKWRAFFGYFIRFLFFAKTRQRLLFLALLGVAISSFALLVLQTTMGGLQNNLIQRSYQTEGLGVVQFDAQELQQVTAVQAWFKTRKLRAIPEYQLELLVRAFGRITPAVVHGLSLAQVPEFLVDLDDKGVLIGEALSYQLRLISGERLQLISPSHTNELLGDIPRQVTATLKDSIETNVPELDRFHIWSRVELIHNLIRERTFNRFRLYGKKLPQKVVQEFKDTFPAYRLVTWEEQNASLVWALNLESTVMVFLFVAMTLLVAISITSGLLIFLDKAKIDLIGLWILGLSQKDQKTYFTWFLGLISFVVTLIGLVSAAGFLIILKNYGADILPDIFIDRKIPVHFTWQGVVVATIVPFCMSFIFSLWTLKTFQKDQSSPLQILRGQ